jgi:hypothetical protein
VSAPQADGDAYDADLADFLRRAGDLDPFQRAELLRRMRAATAARKAASASVLHPALRRVLGPILALALSGCATLEHGADRARDFARAHPILVTTAAVGVGIAIGAAIETDGHTVRVVQVDHGHRRERPTRVIVPVHR